MPSDVPYSISDLAGLTGLTVRTIRYYLAQGLIPASGESGPGAHYGDAHLARLRLVRRLQQQHLPLAEIRARLAALTDAEVADLAASASPAVAEPTTSALDYVRSVLAAPAPAATPLATRAPGAMPAMPAMRDAPPAGRWLRRMAMPSLAEVAAPYAEASAPAPDHQTIERSQWERLSLGPNLELHVRRPLGRLEQKRVERLITIARQVLKEEQP
ncbi:MAG TPA: MerR family transcriptional regulator [Candidatus Limnocylindrales bacterium]|nr:MerR family transcriptional regulator [Candidatus Limnocylindrales bacterium]